MLAIVAVSLSRQRLRISVSGMHAPVGGRKDDRPKLWGGLIELEGHGGVPGLRGLDADHMTALLHFGPFINEEKRLAGLDLHAEPHKAAMRMDDHCLRLFAQLFPLARANLHDDGNLQHYALAAPPIWWLWI